jgi:hypothetical protein
MQWCAALVALATALLPVAAGGETPDAVEAALTNGDTAALRDALAALSRTASVDAAATAFAAAVDALPRNRDFRMRLEAASTEASGGPVASAPRYLFLLVPGWRYRVNVETGADLRQPRAVLERLGFEARLVPLDENGAIEVNARALADAIARHEADGRALILVSTSKGGPETHLALDTLGRSDGARHVAAWVNIGGLLNGTALADYWSGWSQRWIAATGFALFVGLGTEAIPSMATAPRRARFAELRVPPAVLVVNYIGAPLTTDLRVDVWGDFEVIAPHGPNDGLTLLADAIVPQGVTVVERGLDHYFSAPDLDRRIAALAAVLLEELGAPAAR